MHITLAEGPNRALKRKNSMARKRDTLYAFVAEAAAAAGIQCSAN